MVSNDQHLSDVTVGFMEILEGISHDPDEFDDFDLRQYVEELPNPAHVLYQFAMEMHENYL